MKCKVIKSNVTLAQMINFINSIKTLSIKLEIYLSCILKISVIEL